MTTKGLAGNRRYSTLCNVLDKLCAEAPTNLKSYHAPPGNADRLIQARSRALIHLFLKARFGLVDFAGREVHVTDGRFDGGIDAYYIDRKTKGIYLLQSKFRATPQNFENSQISAEDLIKMDVKRIMSGEKRSESGQKYNDKIVRGLQKEVQKLGDAGSYTTKVVLIGNATKYLPAQMKRLVEGYTVDQFSHERIYGELLFPIVNGTYFANPDLIIEINLANLRGETHLDYDVRTDALKVNIKLLFVPTREMGRILDTYKNSILKFNPRSFLELKNNTVNKEIEASIRNSRDNEFALFNNGITIISDQTSISSDTAKQGTAQVVLRNPQLVNGGQTAYTLGTIYDDCKQTGKFGLFKGKEVLLRVITFIGSVRKEEAHRISLIGAISKASNSQTKVSESDRRSNDDLQLRLQRSFFDKHGLFYERKKGEFSDGLRSKYITKDLLINREKLIRAVLSSEYKARLARSNIGRYFRPQGLETLLDARKVDRYAYAYEVLAQVERVRRSKPSSKGDRYHTKAYGQGLRYGQYAVVAVSTNLGIAKAKPEENAVTAVLKQWEKFEAFVIKRSSNSPYQKDGGFDFISYYKGATLDADLQKFTFAI